MQPLLRFRARSSLLSQRRTRAGLAGGMMDGVTAALGLASGGAIGLLLALIGGGGSILAIPLMLYVVGVPDPHVAIGTSALVVALNALIGLWGHAMAKRVRWRCGFIYAAGGCVGAVIGSSFGKRVDGGQLVALFACLMLVVAVMMLRAKGYETGTARRCGRTDIGRVSGIGGLTGMLSGFFGIGGGFLIVPGLMASTRMPIMQAVGTSLFVVTAFGASTTASYAMAGLVDPAIAALFVAGGFVGSLTGSRLAVLTQRNLLRLSC